MSLNSLINVFKENKIEAYFVGGSVRDEMMGRKSDDIDFAVPAKPEEVMQVFEKAGFKVIPTGLKYGTVTVLDEGIGYEITTFRQEESYSDSRHPDMVIYAPDIYSDLSRRDFTVNAIAKSLDGRIIDPFNGVDDINKRIIRCVGAPYDRFNEDALRIMRGIRFAAVLDFEIEENTYKAMKKLSEKLNDISVERIQIEFVKAITSQNPIRAIDYFLNTGVFHVILPEIELAVGMKQNKYHEFTVYEHIKRVVEGVPEDKILRIAALLHDVGKVFTRSHLITISGVVYKKGENIYLHSDGEYMLDGKKFTRYLNKKVMIKGHYQYNHPERRIIVKHIEETKTDIEKSIDESDVKFIGHEVFSEKIGRDFLNRLRFDNDTKDSVLNLVRHHMDVIKYKPAIEYDIKKIMVGIGRMDAARFIQLYRADGDAKGKDKVDEDWFLKEYTRLLNEDFPYSVNELNCDDLGAKIIDIYHKVRGRRPKEEIKKIKEEIFDRVLQDNSLNNEEDILKLAREIVKKY
ncbi:MAG: HD domain-containing protein [Thermoanaerobacteraceae bacterium]|nr:HD domain-containing protein [Thermoanaerobacteraceae bacterium]